jgi:hypothetical protein
MAGIRAEAPITVEQARTAHDEAMRKVWAIWHMGPLQTDWSARLASDWTHVNGRHDNLADATAREFTRLSAGAEYAPRALFAPLLSELTELKAVTLVNWRQALRVHAEDELALYGAKAEVA